LGAHSPRHALKDYIRYRLTGDRANRHGGCIGHADARRTNRRWSPEILNGARFRRMASTLHESRMSAEAFERRRPTRLVEDGTPVVAGRGPAAVQSGWNRREDGQRNYRNIWRRFAATDRPASDRRPHHTFWPRDSRPLACHGRYAGAGLSLRCSHRSPQERPWAESIETNAAEAPRLRNAHRHAQRPGIAWQKCGSARGSRAAAVAANDARCSDSCADHSCANDSHPMHRRLGHPRRQRRACQSSNQFARRLLSKAFRRTSGDSWSVGSHSFGIFAPFRNFGDQRRFVTRLSVPMHPPCRSRGRRSSDSEYSP